MSETSVSARRTFVTFHSFAALPGGLRAAAGPSLTGPFGGPGRQEGFREVHSKQQLMARLALCTDFTCLDYLWPHPELWASSLV